MSQVRNTWYRMTKYQTLQSTIL